MKACFKCGRSNPDDASWCRKCGIYIASGPGKNNNEVSSSTEDKNKKSYSQSKVSPSSYVYSWERKEKRKKIAKRIIAFIITNGILIFAFEASNTFEFEGIFVIIIINIIVQFFL